MKLEPNEELCDNASCRAVIWDTEEKVASFILNRFQRCERSWTDSEPGPGAGFSTKCRKPHPPNTHTHTPTHTAGL